MPGASRARDPSGPGSGAASPSEPRARDGAESAPTEAVRRAVLAGCAIPSLTARRAKRNRRRFPSRSFSTVRRRGARRSAGRSDRRAARPGCAPLSGFSTLEVPPSAIQKTPRTAGESSTGSSTRSPGCRWSGISRAATSSGTSSAAIRASPTRSMPSGRARARWPRFFPPLSRRLAPTSSPTPTSCSTGRSCSASLPPTPGTWSWRWIAPGGVATNAAARRRPSSPRRSSSTASAPWPWAGT